MTKRVLFLISDTGGGHRAGAMAIGAALDEMHKETRFEWRIDDIATHCTFPLSKLGPAYSAALRFAPPIYGALYHATNGRRRYRTIVRFCEPLYRERLKDVFTQYNPDVIVSVHPLLNHAALRARAGARSLQPRDRTRRAAEPFAPDRASDPPEIRRRPGDQKRDSQQTRSAARTNDRAADG